MKDVSLHPNCLDIANRSAALAGQSNLSTTGSGCTLDCTLRYRRLSCPASHFQYRVYRVYRSGLGACKLALQQSASGSGSRDADI